MSVPQIVQDNVAQIDLALMGLLESCTLPIFVEKWKYMRPHATGTLLRIADLHFITTAAHAVIEAAGEGCPLLVGGLSSSKVFGLPEQITRTGRGSMADLAVWRVRPQDVGLFENKRFLTLEDLWLYAVDPGQGPFVLHGFFADERLAAGPDLPVGRVDSVRLYMNCYSGPAPVENYRAEDHLLFSGNPSHVFGQGGMPTSIPPCELLGISGSGVFGVSLNGGRHRLVAIETRKQTGAIQGTRVRWLIELIGTKYQVVRDVVIRHCEQDQWEAEERRKLLIAQIRGEAEQP